MALREWSDKYGADRNHTVKIGGINYTIGGKTAAQKSLGKPDNPTLWCIIGWTGHYAQLIKKEGAERISNDHRAALKRSLFYELFERMKPRHTGSEEMTERELIAFQLDFF